MSHSLVAIALVLLGTGRSPVVRAARSPNFIIVFTDDMGYADIGPFSTLKGKDRPQTPRLDRMAAEGMRLTNFYVAQAVCSASRAALLTGSYSNRVGILGALDHRAQIAINPNELTLAELLKARGYATAIFGKWHLGHQEPFLPLQHGFDEYFGLPYSNDMWPQHPTQKGVYPELPLFEGNAVIERNPDQSRLTNRYTEHAVDFVRRHRDQPFFLYLATSMPHVPLFAGDAFAGRTGKGLYADVVAELDATVGRVLDAVKETGLDNDTLVIFMSDNGPWRSYGNHAGSSGPFRESKGTSFEGGVRVPFLARWPGHLPAGGVSAAPAMTIDLLPTLTKLAGGTVPTDRIIDGVDLWPVLSTRRQAAAPHDALYFYWGSELHAVRSGRWKLHLPHPYQSLVTSGNDGAPGTYVRKEIGLTLFDLDRDPGETTDVAGRHPDVVKQLMVFVERSRADLGDSLTKRTGANVRPPARTSNSFDFQEAAHASPAPRRHSRTLLLYPAASLAVPFQFTYTTPVTPGGTPGVGNPDVLTVRVIADNGGVTAASQSWFQADVISATASAGTYAATFNFPFFTNNPLFTTNAASAVTLSVFFDLDGNNTDNLGPGSPNFFANLLLTSISTAIQFTGPGPADPAAWTVRTPTAVPEPATLLLLGAGLAATSLRRRRAGR